MKIRWTEASVRLRLSPAELERLQRGDDVEEAFSLSGGWRAVLVPNAAQTDLRMEDNALRLSLAPNDLARLAEPDQEGVYFETQTAPVVRYCVEKDFPCTHPRPSEAQESAATFSPPPTFTERQGRSSSKGKNA